MPLSILNDFVYINPLAYKDIYSYGNKKGNRI